MFNFRRRTVIGPCRLGLTNKFATKEIFDSEIRKDLRATGKLRNIFPEDGKCFIRLIRRDQTIDASKNSSPETNLPNEKLTIQKFVQEIALYKPDGTCINDELYNVLLNLYEADKKYSWSQ